MSICRPHDRVSLKDMKVDWQACLDNKVGFKVCCSLCLLLNSFLFFWQFIPLFLALHSDGIVVCLILIEAVLLIVHYGRICHP
jgi:hypothetical protein